MSSIRGVCSIENCNMPHYGKGYCSMHYQKDRKYGNPLHVETTAESHGLSGTPVYNTWKEIKGRCFRESKKAYQEYGARGITMCAGYRNSATAFFEDLGHRPSDEHSIDRIDTNGNYSCGKCEECIKNGWPMNCRWATLLVQSWNKGIRQTNKSGYIGVCKNQGRWMAGISHTENGKRTLWNLGRYSTPEEAAIAYDIACIFFRGSEAKTNIL